ncbi:TPA: type 1 fimbrial protein [Klebsiella oxytoca]|nr:type 1 fimbrial protein [Klebsiella oxytoca]
MKLSMSAGHQNHVRLKVAGGLLALAAGLFSGTAQAISCEFTSQYGWDLTENIPVLGNGLSTAGEDLPIGSIIYSNNIYNPKGQYVSYTCDESTNALIYRRVETLASPSGPPVISGGVAVYPTNIAGIGVTFDIFSLNNSTSTFPDYWEDEFYVGAGGSVHINPLQRVAFKLVKTGPLNNIGVQKVSSSSFPTFRVTLGAKSPLVDEKNVVTIQFQGDVTLHTKTCQISSPQIDVELGSHALTGFTAPGTVTPWKRFDIKLVNCPPFYGHGYYEYWKEVYDVSEQNKVALTFSSAYGTVTNNPKLAKIESGPNSATGVGIELSQADESISIPLDGSSGFELKNLSTNDNATYIIPMQARYVQYDSEVKAGLAKGAVVFTVTYQ